MSPSRPANPYIAGPPLDSEVGFFGREEVLEVVEQTLRYPNRNSVILYGQRRIGKTSLLLQLERRLPTPPFFPIYVDLNDKSLLPTGQVLCEIAAAAADKADMPAPSADDFADKPDAFHQSFLPALYQTLGRETQPIFLLDEFQAVDVPEEELPETAAIRGLSRYLHNLLTTQTYTDFVFAAGRRMEELTTVVRSGFKADLTRFVSVLNPEKARALILQEGAKGLPRYDEAAIERILALTRGHPYLTQLFCRALFDRAFERSRRKPRVTAEDVEAVTPVLLEADDNTLPWIWDSLPPVERITLAATASRATSEKDVLSEAAITSTLSGAGISLDIKGLSRAPENLVNWQVLEQVGRDYGFFIEFMRRWVTDKRPLEQVKKDELSRLDLRAEALYQAARRSYEEDKPKEAVDQLHQALAINPNHLQARLLLGTILREQELLTEAVAAFEEAYKLDPLASGTVLVATLLQLGPALEEVGNYTDALAAYERILTISPDDETARTRRDAVKAVLANKARAAEAAKKARADEARRERRRSLRRLWPALVAGIILLVLLLVCVWAYAPIGTNRAATSTAAAQIAATRIAATMSAIASSTAAIDEAARETPTPTVEPSPTFTPIIETATATIEPTATEPATATPLPQVTATESQLAGEIRMVGSASMKSLVEALALAFTTEYPEVQVVVQGGGSSVGIEAAQQGLTDISLLSRELEATELAELGDWQVQSLAQRDAIAIVTHPLVSLDSLSTAQVRDIFAGEITNWSEVGGADAPILVVSREEGSGTRTVFEQTIMGETGLTVTSSAVEASSDQTVRDIVSSRPQAIGFIALNHVEGSPDIAQATTEGWAVVDTSLLDVKPLALDQVAPSLENAADDTYPLTRPLNLLVQNQPNDLVQAWLDFISSPEGRQIIEQAGHIPAQ